MMATVLITGGTGMIGQALSKNLIQKGYEVIILTRNKKEGKQNKNSNNSTNGNENPGISYAVWDVEKQFIDPEAIRSADYVVHLAGAGISDKRWTAQRKREIVDSRVRSGELLVKKIEEEPSKIVAVVGASAIGWYGPDSRIPNPKPFTENDPPAQDFLAQTCVQWESSLQPLKKIDRRLVQLRTGIVLSRKGGALDEFRKFLKIRLATIPGNGKQIMSWIHIDDLVNLYTRAIENKNMDGIYNAVAPTPVSAEELTIKLARAIKGNFIIPLHIPAFAMRMVLGEISQEALKSSTVSCRKLLDHDYNFKFAEIDPALDNLSK